MELEGLSLNTNQNLVVDGEWMDSVTPQEELEYKDQVATALVNNIHEYLQFSTTKDLLRLIAANL